LVALVLDTRSEGLNLRNLVGLSQIALNSRDFVLKTEEIQVFECRLIGGAGLVLVHNLIVLGDLEICLEALIDIPSVPGVLIRQEFT
jgi:hypothetical protein